MVTIRRNPTAILPAQKSPPPLRRVTGAKIIIIIRATTCRITTLRTHRAGQARGHSRTIRKRKG
jgi:hypothetical protein